MEEGSCCSARLLRWFTEVALRTREPARRAAGSVATAAIVSSICVGIYNLVIGTIYLSESFHFYFGIDGLLVTPGGLAVITTLTDVALICGVLRRKKEYLHNIVSVALGVYLLCGLMPLFVVFAHMFFMEWSYILWELPRLVLYPLHVCLLYCLLAEVRGDTMPQDAGPSCKGWLSSNLESVGHGPLGADKEQKLQVERPNDPESAPPPVPPSGPLSSSEA